MSPKFDDIKEYRFYIHSNEESRPHVHVRSEKKKAKVWLEPEIQLAENNGFSQKKINEIIKIVEENGNSFKTKFRAYIS